MKPVILMRPSLAEEDELKVAATYFPTYLQRSEIPKDSLVIGRYSTLPFHRELEIDVKNLGSELINSTRQHRYVADLREWYQDLKDITPKTWFSLEDFLNSYKKGSFVLKGNTNSKKHQWNTHMFAKEYDDVPQVYKRLEETGLLQEQEIYIRQYISLKNFGTGIKGIPISEEYRFFVLDGKVLTSGFYWSQFPEQKEYYKITPESVPQEFIEIILKKVSNNIRFYVCDVARTITGEWILIELNDGCMSGLSDCLSNDLYKGLKENL